MTEQSLRRGGLILLLILLLVLFSGGPGLSVDVALADDRTESSPAESLVDYDRRVTEEDRKHWAWQPVVRPALPSVRNEAWGRTPIDRFILSRLEARDWSPAPAAKASELLRRMHLDLNGLPPSLAEQDELERDPSAGHFDRIADELLQQPAYGERWARHWLDLVRYAETNGYERDGEKPFVWRYRDYVIDSLNRDKPYDRFVLEQLAGDELPDADSETVIATGFYRLGPWDDEPADPAQDLHDQRDDMIITISQVFLGLTLGCARCHDHKFDALTMHDYYRLSAIVAPLQRPVQGRSDLAAPAGSIEQLARLRDRDRQIAELSQSREALLQPARQSLLESGRSGLPDEVVTAFLKPAAERSPAQQKQVDQHRGALDVNAIAALDDAGRKQLTDWGSHIEQLRTDIPDLPQGYFLVEKPAVVPASFLLLRGRASNPGPPVQPGLPTVLAARQPDFAAGDHSTQRRLTLARWIAHPDNPLTARVIVNRVWQHHFGEGLVRTPSDFGVAGLSPTHPELLDWLAHWFVHDAKWSLKELHRLIVRSNTWRMNRTGNAPYAGADPENLNLWRFPYRRLEVEAIRDSMLAVAGRLNRNMSGPGVYLQIPEEALEGHADKASIWKPFDEAEGSRRTVYAFVKRSLVVPMLEVLDLCDTTRSTDKRNVTSIPPQALTMLNGDFVNQQAAHLADRVRREAGTEPAQQMEHLWRLALCRRPTDAERSAMVNFMNQETVAIASADASLSRAVAQQKALTQACRIVLNLNEFVYPD